MKKIFAGKYSYKNYTLYNRGYYPPDHCNVWEAINNKTGESDFRSQTKNLLKHQIDGWELYGY